jgi:hypothetical protein
MKKQKNRKQLAQILKEREQLIKSYIGEYNKPPYYFEKLNQIDKLIKEYTP